MSSDQIIALLPYSHPFLFVDHLEKITENTAIGTYTFPANSFFYQGHFKNHPITPGVILTETMAQIGLVCLGIYLVKDKIEGMNAAPKMAMTSNEMAFLLPVFPEEKVKVISEKIYFRFGKLKCKVEMYNAKEELVCRGTISGMISQK